VPLQFTVNGQSLTADELRKSAPKAKARVAAQKESYHRGFRVEGHRPGAMEAARDARATELARWAGMSEDSKKKARKAGEREPKEWDEEAWRRKTKPSAVRSKAYEVAEAADVCAQMARTLGWLDVRVVEMKRGEVDSAAIL
jgi:hypothetical protein